MDRHGSNHSVGSLDQDNHDDVPEKKRETRRRTKTGCLTCRKRRIKCDEGKPECSRCLKSKRPCEGYSVKTVFRNENPMHYQQNIRPQPVTLPHRHAMMEHTIQFSMPQYANATLNGNKPFMHQFVPVQPNLQIPGGDPSSRNSSASNASGVSANSEQRRISVLSLMSPAQAGTPNAELGVSQDTPTSGYTVARTPESDARDNYYYNYYISCYSYALSRGYTCVGQDSDITSPEHPSLLWCQTIPNIISEDPPGRRALFDAVVAYTAHLRDQVIDIDFGIYSTGRLARLIEQGLKTYLDIIRDSTHMLPLVENFFEGQETIKSTFKWGILQFLLSQHLGDNKPRIEWMSFVMTKIQAGDIYVPTNDTQTFLVEALKYLDSKTEQIPAEILSLRHNYEFLSLTGIDLLYFALTKDHLSLQNISYHILANPRLEFLYYAHLFVRGARERGEEALGPLATELELAIRNCP